MPVKSATVVPLTIAGDKTQIIDHQGDLRAHAVCLTIGNLPAKVRHAHTWASKVLLCLLPIVKEGEQDARNRLFPELLDFVFRPVKDALNGEGSDVRCADRRMRHCFCVIAMIAVIAAMRF